jgi:hypothetical protein
MPTDVDQTVEVSTVAHPSIEMCGPGVTTWFKQQINGSRLTNHFFKLCSIANACLCYDLAFAFHSQYSPNYMA